MVVTYPLGWLYAGVMDVGEDEAVRGCGRGGGPCGSANDVEGEDAA